MGVSQTKRSVAIDNTISVGANLAQDLVNVEDPCNVHGLILDLWIGSNVGAEHNFGKWAVFAQPRTNTNIPTVNTTNVNDERDSAITWMLGAWMIVDRGSTHIGGAPRTSRNCPRGGRITLAIENSTLSTTAVRVHGVCTWFETQK